MTNKQTNKQTDRQTDRHAPYHDTYFSTYSAATIRVSKNTKDIPRHYHELETMPLIDTHTR